MPNYSDKAKALIAQLGITEASPNYWESVRALNAALAGAHEQGREEQRNEIALVLARLGIVAKSKYDSDE